MHDHSLDDHSASALLPRWGGVSLHLDSRPRLFWTDDDDAELRGWAMNVDGLAERTRHLADEILADSAVFASEPAWHFAHQRQIRDLSFAAWLLEEERAASMASRLLDRAASAESWVAAVHRPMICDHVAANVGATFAVCMDLLSGWLTENDVERYEEAVAEKCLDPFLIAANERTTHWSKRDAVTNWRIMTCGEAGLAALGCGGGHERLDEILALAVEGVVDILDTIPEDGDYVEGPHYFVATLGMGLRFITALAKYRPDVEQYLQHPRLANVADYLIHVTEPDGDTFNYFDNGLGWSADERATMLLMARTFGRGDLAALGRTGEIGSLLQLVLDDRELPSEASSGPTSAHFRESGLVTCRSDWSADATYVGFRCGPNTVGHSHLDCGSFVISRGSDRLAIDEGIWNYAHFLGFFGVDGPRWDFDANDTIGHSTLLIDGQGQVHDRDAPGRIVGYTESERGVAVVGDMSDVYGDLVDECIRFMVYVAPSTVVVYDRVRAKDPRQVEWLLHHRGDIDEIGPAEWSLRTGSSALHVRRLLCSDDDPWRTSDVTRRTNYVESNRLTQQAPAIEFRAWGPIHTSTEHDLLVVLTAGDSAMDAPADDEVSGSMAGNRLDVTVGERRIVIDAEAREVTLSP